MPDSAPPQPVLSTPRLRLRPAAPGDLHDLHRVMSHPDAMAYWSTPPHAHPAQTENFLEGMRRLDPREGVEFVVTHEGRVIGKAGFWRLPEIGFLFHPEFWGQGLAFEALSVLLHHAFHDLRLDRVTADVDPRNARCLKLLQRLGFEETGRAENTFCIEGRWCDSVYLACRTDRTAL